MKFLLQKLSYSIIFLAALLLVPPSKLHAQLTITDNQTAAQLVNQLVGVGVITMNPTLTCSALGSGKFSGTSNLGIDSGIVLTTGYAKTNAGFTGVNAMASSAMTGANAPGDADLNTLSNNTTNNACVLQFDFVPAGDTIKFQYVFGSEEYPTFACSQFNDIFAFLISGPGIVSNIPIPNKKNIALVPGTNIPIAINSVNSGVGGYPVSGCSNQYPGAPYTQYFVNNQSPNNPNIVFNGMTTVLTAVQKVTPCDTYHLKLAVADVGDFSFNSGVFLKAGSLNSIALNAGATGMNVTTNDTAFIVRGCPSADVTIKRTTTGPALTVPYSVSGTAVSGYDYQPLSGTVTIPAGSTTGHVMVKALPVPFPNGDKTVIIKFYSPYNCSANPVALDSAIVVIQDSIKLSLDVPANVAMCFGQQLPINVTTDTIFGPLQYTWTPATGVAAPTINFAAISFPAPGQYHYNISVQIPSLDTNCRVSKAGVTVDVQKVVVNAGRDTAICSYNALQMFAEVFPTDTGSYTYQWLPTTKFNNPSIAAPVFKSRTTENVYVNVTTSAGCKGSDTVKVTVNPGDFIALSPVDTAICPNDSVKPTAVSTLPNTPIQATNTYLWSPVYGVSDIHALTPTLKPLTSTPYYLYATSKEGCIDTALVNITVHPDAVVTLPDSVVIWLGEQYQLQPYTNASYFSWFPPSGLSNPNISNPIANPQVNTRYFFTAKTDKGCTFSDSIDVLVRQEGVVDMPNAFTSGNQTFKPSFRGNFTMQQFDIYDRWGKLVYTSKDVNAGWDGKLNGVPQPVGVYVYVIQLYDNVGKNVVKKTGNVTLLR